VISYEIKSIFLFLFFLLKLSFITIIQIYKYSKSVFAHIVRWFEKKEPPERRRWKVESGDGGATGVFRMNKNYSSAVLTRLLPYYY
jgi:hypothetical protein